MQGIIYTYSIYIIGLGDGISVTIYVQVTVKDTQKMDDTDWLYTLLFALHYLVSGTVTCCARTPKSIAKFRPVVE
jgi:hypothetical protein